MNLINKIRKGIPVVLSSENRQRERFWELLKNHFASNNYYFGAYEKNRTIRAEFTNHGDTTLKFDYTVHRCRLVITCNFLDYETAEDGADIFILAQHMNHLISYDGMIRVDTENQFCTLVFNVDFRPYLLGYSSLDDIIARHHSIAVDASRSFTRLLQEGEEPAIIIADLLREEDDGEDDSDPDPVQKR